MGTVSFLLVAPGRELPRGRVLSRHIPWMPPGRGGRASLSIPARCQLSLRKAGPSPRERLLRGLVWPRRLSPRAPPHGRPVLGLKLQLPLHSLGVTSCVTRARKLPSTPYPGSYSAQHLAGLDVTPNKGTMKGRAKHKGFNSDGADSGEGRAGVAGPRRPGIKACGGRDYAGSASPDRPMP